MERIEKQMQFILEIDKEKQIKRKTLQSNGKDFEDDAQHAWHMAIMTLLLSEYANEKIDVLKTDNVKIKFTKMDRLFFTNLDRII